MKYLVPLFLILITPLSAGANQYYECAVAFNPAVGEACEQYRGRVHMCQLYNWNYSSEVPSHCSSYCLKRSGIPGECATIVVRQSNNPEAHEKKAQGGGSINLEVIGGIKDKIDIDNIGEKMKGTLGNIKDKIDDFSDDELTEEDFEDHSIEGTGLNEYRTGLWPDEDGTKIAKVIDPYGIERYTSDGKHFYDNAYDAAHSQEGVSNMVNKVKDAWSDFTGFFSFRGKLKDEDKELQRQIAREVLKDSKGQREKDIEKAYEKLADKIKTPTFGDVPAKVIIEVAKESSATDFAGGALRYIEQRQEGRSQGYIKENFSEELSSGYGSFGEGVSLSTSNKQAPAVLFARYEETYQRYLLAKELGRTT